ncbi:YbdD/YjiX family protein [Paenibacillus lutrae]|uniref:Putative selenoprotein n=1 Tax=Paenibacillus lutrae TaxID=2078573 RepID=A0A7X3K0Q3_9BACL|nr:YbdD/YjiX family protein [Paenibacillus lutrae]MVP01403.1 putative selenoprotein [Paenibacillus lutrae]
MFNRLKIMWSYRRQFLDLLVGVPNYETYVEHMKTSHCDRPVLSRAEFFRQAQDNRYDSKDGKITRCC